MGVSMPLIVLNCLVVWKKNLVIMVAFTKTFTNRSVGCVLLHSCPMVVSCAVSRNRFKCLGLLYNFVLSFYFFIVSGCSLYLSAGLQAKALKVRFHLLKKPSVLPVMSKLLGV